MKLTESMENYLETIFILQETKGHVRSIYIAEKLGYSKASVSRAVKNLTKLGLILMDNQQEINFTKKGYEVAERIYDRHKTLTDLLSSLGVSSEQAQIDACKIEHVISEETFSKIKKALGQARSEKKQG